MHLHQAKQIWQSFADIPVNNDDEIETAFMQFPAGTSRFDIWHWLEDSCPDFSVYSALYPK